MISAPQALAKRSPWAAAWNRGEFRRMLSWRFRMWLYPLVHWLIEPVLDVYFRDVPEDTDVTDVEHQLRELESRVDDLERVDGEQLERNVDDHEDRIQALAARIEDLEV